MGREGIRMYSLLFLALTALLETSFDNIDLVDVVDEGLPNASEFQEQARNVTEKFMVQRNSTEYDEENEDSVFDPALLAPDQLVGVTAQPCPHSSFKAKHICSNCNTEAKALTFSFKRPTPTGKNTVFYYHTAENYSKVPKYGETVCQATHQVAIRWDCFLKTSSTSYCNRYSNQMCTYYHSDTTGHYYYPDTRCH